MTEAVDLRSHLLDVELVGGAVGVVDDPRRPPVLRAQHPRVPEGILEPGGEHGGGGVLCPMLTHEMGERGVADERRVTGQDQEVTLVEIRGEVVGEPGERYRHRISCTPRLELLDELESHVLEGFSLDRLHHLVGTVADDDDHTVDRQSGESVEDVDDHRAPAQAVEGFGGAGSHPSSLACRQNDG